jgi:hypothetical protein
MDSYPEPVPVDFVRGDGSGLAIPAHAAALSQAGPAFLTSAFHRFGSLPASNRVVRITRCESFAGGNSGHKVLLSVQYAEPAPGLHEDLFVKFSRDFDDAFRDRRRYELQAEVRFAVLTRLPDFPISVPLAYFADFENSSGTGLLITQCIAFGTGDIEPMHPKCMDQVLADPLSYYRAVVLTLARLVAAHQSGRMSDQVESLFPFDPEMAAAEDPIPFDEAQLEQRVDRYAQFAANSPQLLPANLIDPAFISRLKRDVVRYRRHEAAIKRYLQADRDYIALCHYNANIDNAWFWRDVTGGLHCGLLDWGRVRQMNVAYALWGSLCGASLSLWNEHIDELLTLFIQEVHRSGGRQMEMSQLRTHLHFYAATMGLATLIDAPTLVLARLPEAAAAGSQLDPLLLRNEVARTFLHVFTSFLNLWQTQDIGATLDRWLQERRP